MPTAPECQESTEEYPEDGSTPSGITSDNITRENKGPCACCQVCSIDLLNDIPSTLCVKIVADDYTATGTLTQSTHPDTPYYWSGGATDGAGNDLGIELIIGENCLGNLNVIEPTGTQCGDTSLGFPDDINVGLTFNPFYVKSTYYPSRIDCVGRAYTIIICECPEDEGPCPDEPPDSEEEPSLWWCVETPTYPFRECVQGVTEAVQGGYATQEECEADEACLPANFYCCRLVPVDGAGNETAPPTFECQALTDVEVGDISTTDGIRRTVMDGPFTEGDCQCPPCSGQGIIGEPTGELPPCDEPEAPVVPEAVKATVATVETAKPAKPATVNPTRAAKKPCGGCGGGGEPLRVRPKK